MANSRTIDEQSKEALALRVEQLEQEVLRLQGQLRQPRSTEQLFAEPSGPVVGLINNAWLILFGQHLLLEPDKNNINSALARLGQLFDVQYCGFWRALSDEQTGYATTTYSNTMTLDNQCIGEWQSHAEISSCHIDWLQKIARSHANANALLQSDSQVIINANDAQFAEANGALQRFKIVSSLMIPVVRSRHLEGYLILHRADASAWYERDMDRLKYIAHVLFTLNDRQQLVRQLSDRDTRFNYAIEASSDGLWDWNITTGRVYFSRSYLRMLGYQYESLPGNLTTLHNYFLYDEDIQKVKSRYETAIEKCETHVNMQFRMQHQSGRILWVQSKAKFCEPDTAGRPTRCVGLNTDISDFIKVQDDLMAAKTEADAANKTKGEFLARMSHEIRTPMNAIIGLGYLLNDTALDEQQKSYLASLNSASDSLLHIINEVLDFSKIDTGKIILEQANFDLDSLFEKLSRLFEISANDKTIRIIYDIKADVPRFLRGDAIRLSQIINHLISNALQYSETTEVVVGVKLQNVSIKSVELAFSITDFGVGMSAKRLAQVNESLQTHVRMSDTGRGSFGLGICSYLTTLMGGSMDIDSAPGQGCRVTFTATFEYSHLGAKVLPHSSRALHNIRALIVDDNVVARTVIAATAKNIDVTVGTAESAEQALAKVNQADALGKPFHFVLMDYGMPNMNGLEAAAAIKNNKQLHYSPHIILVSAFHRDEIASSDNIALNVDEFLSKPVSEARLFDAMNNAISKDIFLQELTSLPVETSVQDAALNNLRVLVVDDNLVNQQVVRGVLKKKGIQVVLANNGIEAVNAISASDTIFDLILMDLEMPEMDGIEATKAIRKGNITPNIPIIALTAQAMRGDREHCLAAGMNAYLSKPINPELLFRTVADQINAYIAKKVE
jgi:two-component system, sensor histidine kinase and response regulator